MMTLSHPVPTFGDSFTITCYTCGMPSSKEWAQKARSRPTTPMKPYFPFLLQLSPLNGAIIREDGSTYLCAFCHASLEAQWNVYESQQVVPPPNRKYSFQKFICAVCGVETYRKRIRALPFQEFPFLEKTRQPGSITLGNNPLAIVCLDCSETLWAQSAEYDRWGLPVHKRHFNWMARPPPPEDSVEATVARLPSGETQLPRCPPIEPTVLPTKGSEATTASKALDVPATKSRSKTKGDSPKMENMMPMNMPSTSAQTGRKSSLTSTTPPALEMMGGYHGQQAPVPVVTVAPMSSHTTVISLRKDSLALPHGLITAPEAQGSPGIYAQAPVFSPAAAYSPFMWTNTGRQASQRAMEPYPYGPSGSDTMSGPTAWPWMPQASSDLLRYQTYMSLQSRHAPEPISNRVSSSTGSPTHTPRPSSNSYTAESTPRYQSAATSTIVGGSREPTRSAAEEHTTISTRCSGGSGSSDDQTQQIRPPPKLSPELRGGKRSPKAHSSRDSDKVSHRPYPTHSRKLAKDQKDAVTVSNASANSSICNLSSESLSTSALPCASPQQSTSCSGDDDAQEKVAKREHHIPKKRNWQVFMKDSQSATVEDESKKVQEISHHPKKKKASYSFSDAAASEGHADSQPVLCKDDGEMSRKQGRPMEESRPRPVDSAMDLTIVPVKSSQLSQQALKGAGAKFMIEYLCQSEPSRENDNKFSSMSYDDSAARTSVIKCGPKIPVESASQPSKSERFEDGSEYTTLSLEESAEQKAESDEKKDTEDDVLRARDKNDDDEKHTTSKDESDDNEGKSERKQQASSTIHDDDVDERKNEDLPNIEQFIKETITDLVKREQEQEKMKQEVVDKQKQFLQTLGLITPDKKIELEIKSIVSRHARNTLPPLKLRADTKLEKKIDKQLKDLLLKVALNDPTLFQVKPETEKCDFMAELGMRTVGKTEKAKREVKWKVILMERIRRELRDAASRGVKHEWEKSEIFKKFANCDLDSFFDNLCITTSESSEENGNDGESCEDKDSDSDKGSSGVCINYPKYIPSYAVAGPSIKSENLGDVDAESEPAITLPSTSTVTESSSGGTTTIEPILKIPVLLASRRVQSESSASVTTTSEIDEAEFTPNDKVTTLPASLTHSVSHDPIFGATEAYPIRIDNLIQSSATYWEQVKRNIDDILNELESSKEDVPLEEKGSHIDKIRNHLKSQLSDIKGIEKRLRATGKHILSSSKKKSQARESERK
ncbi:unnamed protein product [Orchesella dallaii]|uniref:Uncharacterized protein n=1 Tax=Orchesella dallaii TaxID=48710 RepID=A0ABP1QCW7_9HEXA